MLIDRGATLVSDDHTELRYTKNCLSAWPAPHIAGQIEVRNLGIVPLPHVQDVPVALLVTLDTNAPRFIEALGNRKILGQPVPQISFTPHSAALAIKLETALRHQGLTI